VNDRTIPAWTYASWTPANGTAEVALPRIWRTTPPARLEDTQAIHLLDLKPAVTRVETAGARWRRKARTFAADVRATLRHSTPTVVAFATAGGGFVAFTLTDLGVTL
jgi:hypothetical protein